MNRSRALEEVVNDKPVASAPQSVVDGFCPAWATASGPGTRQTGEAPNISLLHISGARPAFLHRGLQRVCDGTPIKNRMLSSSFMGFESKVACTFYQTSQFSYNHD